MEATAIIIDDEEGARESLANILNSFFPHIKLVGKADSATKGFELISEKKPNIVFLDIEMPNENAFDLIDKFDRIDFDIIFVTAYDHYAVQAIKASALDYLLKPIDVEELKFALEKYEVNKTNPQQSEQLNLLMETVRNTTINKKIAIPESDGLTFVAINEIIRCESDGNYTSVFLKDGSKILSSKTLGDYEEILRTSPFFRTHRSHLINMNEIHKFVKGDGGYILMSDRSEVEISRRKKQDFLAQLTNS